MIDSDLTIHDVKKIELEPIWEITTGSFTRRIKIYVEHRESKGLIQIVLFGPDKASIEI